MLCDACPAGEGGAGRLPRQQSCIVREVPEVLYLLRVSRVSLVALAAALSGAAAPLLAQAPQYHPPVVAANDTLAGVDYNYRYELYGGFSYTHFNAGPNLLQGANLGGFSFDGARFFTRRWAAAASGRGYYGTTGVAPNDANVRGPAVSQYMFMGGPEYRALSNQHASLTLHALFGGAYGRVDSDIAPETTAQRGLFSNQVAFGGAFGGAIDLNRSPRLAFRIQPEATLTNYGGAGLHEQVAISVGLVYRLGRKIEPVAPGAPRPAVSR